MDKMTEMCAADREELDAVYRIEQESFADAWSMDTILEFHESKHDYVHILKIEDEVLAFVIFRIIGDEAELLRIAVAGEHRHKSLGHMLLEHMIGCCLMRYVSNIFLEVRKSNKAAIKLYEKSDFIELGIRKDYYSNPVEDAIIYAQRI